MAGRIHGRYVRLDIGFIVSLPVTSGTGNRKHKASDAEVPTNVDDLLLQVDATVHTSVVRLIRHHPLPALQILNSMLSTPRWEALANVWDEERRKEVNAVWHGLNGT
jgi:hypothetical protein